MKKIILPIIAILTLLSCSNDKNTESINNNLEHVKITNSYNEDVEIEYYSNGIKFLNSYKNNILVDEATYNDNDQLIKKTSFQNNEINVENTFTYNENGMLSSVHEFNVYNTSQHQDRPITWVNNKMIIPYLNNNGNTDIYEFTFNDNDLLTNFKHKLENGTTLFNSNYEYDINDNVIRKSGTKLNQIFDITYTYDDRINPYFSAQKKYRRNDFIILGKKIQNTNIYPVDLLITGFGKNNYLSGKDMITNSLIENYSQPSYDGNITTQIRYKNRLNTFETIHEFFYEN